VEGKPFFVSTGHRGGARVIGISVIVPVRNAAHTIGACLDGLQAQSVSRDRYEVIVVDDGSTDDTRDIVKGHSVILLTQAHEGPAAARNRGVGAARGEIVLFTDADCVPGREWIEEMVRPFDDPEVVGVKGAYRTRQEEIVARFVQREYEERYERMARRRFIDFIDTYSAGYRREVFLAQGGFDTAYPNASVEDQELSFRLAERGHKMVFNPRAAVYHQHPDSVALYFKRKLNIGYWKVRVLQSHPGKAVRDSHTPQTLKAQMVLVTTTMALALLVLWRSSFCSVASLSLLLLLISVMPFSLKAFSKDPPVGLISPFMLLVRAVALGLGMIGGLWDLVVRRKAVD
jgi:cellulose synthase/poly-beta-1,6-N-acetylglucosamine synthase-like glycosyltransferase